ncbi:probable disease resistance protein At4g27220 [Camellia sinensis]|uniref:probable disease resistance protein At4g27220 n=1 Tax=Camellia sinensis TaxID=4442 RepID=UPI0010363CA3|nr:probable disease resistance protein At4g27220 [Camellia sinensis]
MRILRYLKSSSGKGLYFLKHGHLRVEAYTDANWAGSVTDRRSTSGYCTFVGGNLVTWRNKKQNVVARSSAEAEFRAMTQGVCELLWIRLFLRDLGIHQTDSMRLYCDNTVAINIAHNSVQQDRTKHVEIDRHFIKEKLTSGTICTPFVRSGDQLADVLTKGLGNKPFRDILNKLDMAMAALDALISIEGKVVEFLVEPVGRQFSYVLHRIEYIEDLRDQVEKLEPQRIDVAKKNREEILENVKNWIEKVDGFIVEAKKFLEDGTNVNQKCFIGRFPDLVTRCQLGKEAKDKVEVAKDLETDGYFNSISKPARPLGIKSIPSERLVTYETTNLAMMSVMKALTDDNINFIGIHVSQNPDIKKIQDQIAVMLGFTKFTDQSSEIEIGSMLRARLKDVKKILIILDDIWDRFELTTLGIPLGQDHEGCKIIITTRREQVCRTMAKEWERTKIVWLDVLSEQDSWDLFRKNVADVVDSSALNDVAKEVCKECGGLPIAVVTVGKAMKGKYNLEEWKNVAQELKKSLPTNIEGVDRQVYKTLRLSYDYLQDAEAKDCFLLCSLFPEDHDILIEDLVRYGMGLRLFKNVDTVQETRSRAKPVINNLMASCLLLASDVQDCIKMHDVVHDVAIFIGSKKHFVRAGCNLKDWPNVDSLDKYTGISLTRNQISNLPEVLECSKLQILPFHDNRNAWSCSHEFLSRMNALSALDWSRHFYPHLDNPICCPDTFNNQTCLRTLVLEGIKFGDTKFLGQLKTLEVLNLKRAFFSKVPNAIRELTNLRLLDMTRSFHEFLILAAMVSPLCHLEELELCIYPNLQADVEGLNVFEHLRIKDCCQFEYLINIEEWGISPQAQPPDLRLLFNMEELKIWKLDTFKGICPGALTTSSWACFPKLRSLEVNACPELSTVLPFNLLQGLQHLEKLFVSACEKLEQVFDFGPEGQGMKHILNCSSHQHVQLCNLRSMEVHSCGKLKYVFQPSIAQALYQLEVLWVSPCEEMEERESGLQDGFQKSQRNQS